CVRDNHGFFDFW
nr:immunoglobulin heavy chain junction region [Macaca mulatta]MOW91477.1 immunoglobulin heavy chain junction region [Macaca mulatta]